MDSRDQRIGQYDLVKLLGKGPFTEVYLGQNVLVREIRYAVKRPSQMSVEHLQLLQRRVYILSQLDYHSIVKSYPLDSPEPAIGLTFAQQGSLYERISIGNSCDLRFIIHCTLQLTDALAYAHNKGFVHGNLKPQNILFGQNEAVLLSDFDVPTLPFSQSQPVLRELPYKAPEQEKQRVSPATDQYQLARLVDDWQKSQRNSLQASPEVINAFQQTLRKAQNADEEQRYLHMRAFAQELEKVAAALPQTAVAPVRQPVRRYIPLIWSGIALFLLLVLAGGLLAGLSLKYQIAIGLTPTAQPPAGPQTLYREITSTQPMLDNPSAGDGVGQWSLLNDRFGGGCSLNDGTLYLVSPSPLSPEVECLLSNLTERDFAFQVELHFLQTDQSQGYMAAGLLLRTNYQFFLNTGFYNCYFTIQFASSEGTNCPSQRGRGATDILTVIARQDTFYLYINHTFVETRKDGQYPSGSLGVFLENNDPTPTRLEVSFTNVKVWILQGSSV